MGLFGNPAQPVQMEISSPYAPVRRRTPTVRAAKVILWVFGVYPIIHSSAQLQLAAENDRFEERVPSAQQAFLRKTSHSKTSPEQ